MVERYELQDMRELWLPYAKFQKWLDVELAVLSARSVVGEIPRDVYEVCNKVTRVDVARITELEKEFKHDMNAFVVSVQEQIQNAWSTLYASEFHKGLTSSNIEDPALILMLRDAIDLISAQLQQLSIILRNKAKQHKWTYMIPRTHGQYAEPTTFGHELCVFLQNIIRGEEQLKQVYEEVLCCASIS
ncbi:MAG: adenylosuccinate lyase, partial [Parcubacteria group bacterium Gr01-1014_70]